MPSRLGLLLASALAFVLAASAAEKPARVRIVQPHNGDTVTTGDVRVVLQAQGVSGIIHLGRGQSEFTFSDVPAGGHRLIAVVADGDHVPLQPPLVDTVRFVVKR